MTPPTDAGEDAYEAGLRAGYAHGYDVGLAHGRTRAEDDLELEDAAVARAVRLGGPTRDELIARGRIPRDHTRPPALPVRLWDAADWAKADHRDLPTTEHGHAQWRDALAAGRVPSHLADAYVEAHPQRGASIRHLPASSTAELADRVALDVADSGRAVTAARSHFHRTDPSALTPGRGELLARRRVADTAVPETAHGDRGLGR